MGLWKNRPKRKPAPANAGGGDGQVAGGQYAAQPLEAEVLRLRQEVAALDGGLQEARQQQASGTIRTLVGVIEATDAFERVFVSIRAKEDQVTPQMKVWIGNFRTILRLLNKVLSDNEVLPLQNLEAGFDANWHQAFETVADSTEPDGTILEEIQKGYVWRGQLLRKASVVVACKAGQASEPEAGASAAAAPPEAPISASSQPTDGHEPVPASASGEPTV